ncbi:hypothetical protein PSTT_05370 [Puccinia striiformis]|uniref:Amino acid transporter transmembrane domain-containing protein n=1 Tax=Puccinia striiformis TaxID=27350 RepID=A0A2S4VP51_9BASI|nr:hypothetical protein PSTT_05370 [Puccinia striiformis]
MDQEATPTNQPQASPPDNPEHPHAGYRSVIASSINLVQSYRRSQLFPGDNLPNSFSESSFNANYLSSRDQRGVHDGTGSEYDDDDQSYATFSDRDGEERAEGDEEYSDDDEGDRDLPSSFLPPNAFGSRRLPPSRLSRASQASFPRQWTRRPSGSTRSHQPNHEGDLSGGPNSPRSLGGQHNKTLERPLPPKLGRRVLWTPLLNARSSFTRRGRLGSEAGSAVESSDPRQGTLSHCSSNHSRVDLRHAPLSELAPSANPFQCLQHPLWSGLLSEPLAFSAMGWIGGVIMFVFCGLSTNYTAKILARLMAEDRFLLTYNDICYKAFGRSMQYPIAGLFCLELFALSVALMVIFGDSLATIFPDVSTDSFKILAFCLVLPTVFMPFQILSYTSLIGLVSSITLVGAVVFDGLIKEDAPGSIFHPAKTSLSPSHRWGLSAGLMMSGFSGHSVMPSLAREMRNPQDFNRMVDLAYLAAGSMYLIVGMIGYLMFGDDVSQEITHDILRTPGFPKLINQVTVIMIGINPLPVLSRPLNITIEHLLNLTAIDDMGDPHAPPVQKRSTPAPAGEALPKNATSNRGQQLTPRSTHSDLRGSYHEVSTGSVGKSKPAMLSKAFGRTISRTVVTCLVVIVSILVPNFERVMSFLGAFAAFVICTILPVSAEMILTRDKEGARRRRWSTFSY